MTDPRFRDKALKVLAIDPSGAGRQLLTDILKQSGFENAQGLASVKDAIECLEAEHADWIIAPLEADKLENGLALLKLCTVIPKLRTTRISLLLAPEENWVLSHAFQMGMFSWFKKPFTKDTFAADMKKFTERMAAWNHTPALIAASYLRDSLKELKLHDHWLNLEKSLLKLFPGSPQLLLHLAESQFLTNHKDAGKNTLRQVMLLDPNAKDAVIPLKNQYLGVDEPLDNPPGKSESFNILGIENVVIVDSDGTIQQALKDIFTQAGVSNIQIFDNGEAAAAHVKQNNNPGLIIQEWRIPKLTGPLLLQRFIAEGATTTPIIVLSSLIQPTDMPLVKEMGVANVVSKPFDKQEFLKSLIWTVQQDRSPSEGGALERKIRNLFRAKKYKDADALAKEYLSKADVPLGKKRLIEAEMAYIKHDYPRARDLCVETLKSAGDSIFALNLLGKTFMRLQEYDAALKCLKKAQDLAPMNIERLCSIAEAQTELGDQKAADKTLGDATDIDPDSKTVKEAQVNVAVAKGDTDEAKKLMGQLESLDDILSYMNNKAVALARCGMTAEGIEQYNSTIKSIPDTRDDLKSLVYYNLALAYARAGELDNSIAHLDKAAKGGTAKIIAKVKSLKSRVETAVKSGGDFKLLEKAATTPHLNVVANSPAEQTDPTARNGDQKKPETTSAAGTPAVDKTANNDKPAEDAGIANFTLVDEVMNKQGDICCYNIFVHPQGETPESKKLLETLPKFKVRKTIEREETIAGGAKKSS